MNNYSYLKLSLISCFLLLGLATAFAQSTLPDPVFYYQFEDGSGNFVTDAGPNGDDGEIFGTFDTTWVDGYDGGGFLFDGATYIACPSFDLQSNSGSFAAWVKGYSGGRIKTIFSAGDNETGGGFGAENEMHLHLEEQATDVWAGGEASFYQHNGGATEFFIWSDPDKGLSSAGVPPVNPTTFIDSIWRHITVVWGGGNIKMYVNGDLLADTTWNAVAPNYQFSVIRIGSMLGGGRAFQGVLDEVQAFDWLLSDAEVMEVYSQATNIGKSTPAFEMKAYPNPANDQLNVTFASKPGVETEVAILNSLGQTLNSETITTSGSYSSHKLNVSKLPAGVYMVKVTYEGKTALKKVFVD